VDAVITILILVVYVAGLLFVCRVVAGHLAYEFGKPDGEDFAMSIMAGALVGLIWPVILPVWFVWRYLPSLIIAKPREVALREREQALRARERKVERLERELEIRS